MTQKKPLTRKSLVERGDKAKNPKPGIPLNKEKIAELIIKHYGNLTKVAIALQCARGSVRRVIQADADLTEILAEARERVVDEVEDSFTERARSGDTTAAIFFLKTRARDRGYDQDFRQDIQAVTRAALEFALNKSKNPAEQ